MFAMVLHHELLANANHTSIVYEYISNNKSLLREFVTVRRIHWDSFQASWFSCSEPGLAYLCIASYVFI